MSQGPSLAAARRNDRISHGGSISSQDSAALVAVALGAVLGKAQGGFVASRAGAGVAAGGGASGGAVKVQSQSFRPTNVTGKIEDGSPNTFLGKDKLGAALVMAQKVDCHQHRDKPIRMGSISVFVNGQLFARQTDKTDCGALIADGDPTILVGGATSDESPPDPLAALEGSAAAIGQAFGAALAQGASTVRRVLAMGEQLVERAWTKVESVVADAEDKVVAAEGEIAAKAGQVIGQVQGAVAGVAGSLLGSILGGAPPGK